jgi:tryptophan synthase beta chain
MSSWEADEQGWFGGPEAGWGGRYMPEALVKALDELTVAWQEAMADPTFVEEFAAICRDYATCWAKPCSPGGWARPG